MLITQDPTKLVGDEKPAPMGNAEEVRARLSKSLPKIDWSDPQFGVLQGPDWNMEFNHEAEGITDSVMLHVRGGGNPIPFVVKVCKENGWVAFDTTSGELIDLNSPNAKSWKQFREFRDAASEQLQPQKQKRTDNKIAGIVSAIFLIIIAVLYALMKINHWQK